MSYTTYYERRQKIAKHEAEQLEHLLEKQAMTAAEKSGDETAAF